MHRVLEREAAGFAPSEGLILGGAARGGVAVSLGGSLSPSSSMTDADTGEASVRVSPLASNGTYSQEGVLVLQPLECISQPAYSEVSP